MTECSNELDAMGVTATQEPRTPWERLRLFFAAGADSHEEEPENQLYLLGFLAMIALAMCSCRAQHRLPPTPIQPAAHSVATAVTPGAAFAGMPAEAFTGHPGDGFTEPGKIPGHMRQMMGEASAGDAEPVAAQGYGAIPCAVGPPPLPIMGCGPWKPAGIDGPWPPDEYIFDGGDSDGGVKVRDDWTLLGLDPEDTVAHYDTLDGRTVVKPTNRVCIYSPRFASVRQVSLAHGDNQLVKAGGVENPVGLIRQDEVQPVTTALQPLQPVAEIGERATVTFLEKVPAAGIDAEVVAWAVQDRFKAYEDFDIIRRGIIEEGEKPFLAKSIDAAIQWTADLGVQVTIDGVKAVVLEGDQRAQATYRVDLPDKPCLRVCKVASTPSAKPGEIVEFTLRFDNVGDQTIGNVTLVDNLTTRLELIPGSGQASVKADFSTEPNPQGSLILRWEINEPLKPGEGGIARFKCRVR